MTTLKRVLVVCALALVAIAACSGVTRYSSPPPLPPSGLAASASVSPTPAYNYPKTLTGP